MEIKSVSELIGYRQMQLDMLPKLVDHRIPVILVAGGSDTIVPFHENGILLQNAYEQAAVECEVHIKPECEHHPPVWKHRMQCSNSFLHIERSHLWRIMKHLS